MFGSSLGHNLAAAANAPGSLGVCTIAWLCQDFPELKVAQENYVLNNFDPNRSVWEHNCFST